MKKLDDVYDWLWKLKTKGKDVYSWYCQIWAIVLSENNRDLFILQCFNLGDIKTNELILFWTFAVNSDECLLTRMQEMSLDYHFTVEQEVGSSTHAFFGFNGKNNNGFYMITKIII